MPRFVFDSSFLLESGASLQTPSIHYELYGELNSHRNNVIIVCHTLFGGIDRSSFSRFWFLDSGVFIDLNKYCILMMANLGSSHGSTSPNSVNPLTQERYLKDFPVISILDSVRMHRMVIEHLGISSIYAVVGGSFGGFSAFTWLTQYPTLCNHAFIFESDIKISQFSAAAFALVKDAFLFDQKWNDGKYSPEDISSMRAMNFLQRLNRLCQVTPKTFDNVFSKKSLSYCTSDLSSFIDVSVPVERWILNDPPWEGLDPNSLLCTLASSSIFDLRRLIPDYAQRWCSISTNVFLIACNQDIEYPPEKMINIHSLLLSLGVASYYYEFESDLGHGSFLSNPSALKPILKNIEKIIY